MITLTKMLMYHSLYSCPTLSGRWPQTSLFLLLPSRFSHVAWPLASFFFLLFFFLSSSKKVLFEIIMCAIFGLLQKLRSNKLPTCTATTKKTMYSYKHEVVAISCQRLIVLDHCVAHAWRQLPHSARGGAGGEKEVKKYRPNFNLFYSILIPRFSKVYRTK